MIKRRFYKQDHGDHDDAATDSSDSSSSGSDSPPQEEEDRGGHHDDAEEEDEEEENQILSSPPPGSGYESEDSSGNEVRVDSSGLLINEEEECSEGGSEPREASQLIREAHAEEPKRSFETPAKANDSIPDLDSCILKHKSVFKCRLCPRIVCLSEQSVRAHLSSKRHARSKKLLGEGRLKLTLNSDGEVEEEQETHAERHARTVALAQETNIPNKTDEGLKRQKRRRNKKLQDTSSNGRLEETTKKSRKKQRKNMD